MLKVTILFFYYDKEEWAKEYALYSIMESTYPVWELCVIDDSNEQNAEDIVDDFLSDNPEYEECRRKIKFYPTGDSDESKRKRGNSVFGIFGERAMYETNGDICIMLCDDDALCKDYLASLNCYYSLKENKKVPYSFGHVMPFPTNWCFENDTRLEEIKCIPFDLNRSKACNPFCNLDSSQVSWRIKNAKDIELHFPAPLTKNIDAVIYDAMYKEWGKCPCNGSMAQYKGHYQEQLGNSKIPWEN